jgi:hypothetical protein
MLPNFKEKVIFMNAAKKKVITLTVKGICCVLFATIS